MMESDCCSAMVQSDQGEAVMTTEAHVRGSPKILVDDDEEAARENLQRLLESRAGSQRQWVSTARGRWLDRSTESARRHRRSRSSGLRRHPGEIRRIAPLLRSCGSAGTSVRVRSQLGCQKKVAIGAEYQNCINISSRKTGARVALPLAMALERAICQRTGGCHRAWTTDVDSTR